MNPEPYLHHLAAAMPWQLENWAPCGFPDMHYLDYSLPTDVSMAQGLIWFSEPADFRDAWEDHNPDYQFWECTTRREI